MKKTIILISSGVLAVAASVVVIMFILISNGDDADGGAALVHIIRIELQKYVEASVDENHISLPKRPMQLERPDYYLIIVMRNGEMIRTPTYDDTPIGNGLEWQLDPPIALNQIKEVQIHDEDLFSDEFIDRVLVNNRREEGQTFDVYLESSPDQPVEEDTP